MTDPLLPTVEKVEELFKQSFAAVPTTEQMQQGGQAPPPQGGPPIDPATGQPMAGGPPIDPATGQPMAPPQAGPPIDPATGQPAGAPPQGGPPQLPEELVVLLNTMSERMERIESELDHQKELQKTRESAIKDTSLTS